MTPTSFSAASRASVTEAGASSTVHSCGRRRNARAPIRRVRQMPRREQSRRSSAPEHRRDRPRPIDECRFAFDARKKSRHIVRRRRLLIERAEIARRRAERHMHVDPERGPLDRILARAPSFVSRRTSAASVRDAGVASASRGRCIARQRGSALACSGVARSLLTHFFRPVFTLGSNAHQPNFSREKNHRLAHGRARSRPALRLRNRHADRSDAEVDGGESIAHLHVQPARHAAHQHGERTSRRTSSSMARATA